MCLPQKMAIRMGNISPLCIVSRVGSGLYVIDPLTLQSSDVSNDNYWRTPFRSLCSYKQLTEFVVLNVELLGPTRGKVRCALQRGCCRRFTNSCNVGGTSLRSQTLRWHG